MFRALKTKKNTPKYGLIYNASLVGQAKNNLKGKISRTLANKCALCVRFDALGENEDGKLGVDSRVFMEKRLKLLEAGGQVVKAFGGQQQVGMKRYAPTNSGDYNEANDFTKR